MKIKPQVAFDAVKVLWPDAVLIRQGFERIQVNLPQSTEYIYWIVIDWPEGVTEWPEPEPEWVNAKWDGGWNSECRFSDDRKLWVEGVLLGFCPGTDYPWWNGEYVYKFCQTKVRSSEAI